MKTLLYIFGLTLGLIGCNNTITTDQNSTPQPVKHIKVSELNQIANVDNSIFLDVRTPEEFKNGSIPNAIHLDYYDSNFKSNLEKLDKSQPYIVFCKSGFRSEKATELMCKDGFKHIYNLIGGYDAWRK